MGEGTLLFPMLHVYRITLLWDFKILIFNIVFTGGGGQKNDYFWGYGDSLGYFIRSLLNWTII